MANQRINCCAVILAAGQSDRMGSPKQLLEYKGKTLLQHAIDEAKQSNVESVIVVLGHAADSISAATQTEGFIVVRNDAWESGMASSIVAALSILKSETLQIDAIILMVCDQPFLDAALLNKLIGKYTETGKPIVASEYAGTKGTPVLFGKDFFDRLLKLTGDEGAKKLINQNSDSTVAVPFPLGNVDIDTPEAYRQLTQNAI